MSFTLASHLPNLTTREAITDALHRCVAAFDQNSSSLLQDSMTTDAVFSVEGFGSMTGLVSIIQNGIKATSHLDIMHYTSDIRIDVASENAVEGRMTANVIAYHYPKGTGLAGGEMKRFVRGSKVALEVVKDAQDGLWKIRRWDMKVIWMEGDASIMQPPPA